MSKDVTRRDRAELGSPPAAEEFLDANPRLEVVLTALKAGLASAPFAGGVASLLSDTIPSARLRRLEDFARHIGEDLRRLEDRVSEERTSSEHFAYMFERSFQGAAEEYQREKFHAFRGVLINSALPSDLSEEEEEYFLGLVSRLSVLHLRILRFMAQPEAYLSDISVEPSAIQGGFKSMFSTALPGVSTATVQAAFQDLYDAGLITTDKGIFGTMTAGSGLPLLKGRVSELGSRFISFCTVPRE